MNSIELFAGCGGLALGVSRAGFKHQLVVEKDVQAFHTLNANKTKGLEFLDNWPLALQDVADVDYSALKGRIKLISGGPPCQPFSIGGKHKGPNDKRNMWSEAVRSISEVKPDAFIFENVRGLLRPAFKSYFELLTLQLQFPSRRRNENENRRKYRKRLRDEMERQSSPEFKVLIKAINAADYGVPQKRHRAIIIGVGRHLSGIYNLPKETHSEDALLWDQYISREYWSRHHIPIKRQKQIPATLMNSIAKLKERGKPKLKPWVTVRDVIGDLPKPITMQGIVPNHILHPGARIYRGHTGSQLDEPAKALKAGAHGVPGGENVLVIDGAVRYFTIREMARLQGFPDDFSFNGTWISAIKQIGNAVPVQIGEFFGQSLINVLKK